MKPARSEGSPPPPPAPGEPPDPHAFGELDAHLMREGTHPRLHDKLGAHPTPQGTRFAVWAPNAVEVSVIGDFNDWNAYAVRNGLTLKKALAELG